MSDFPEPPDAPTDRIDVGKRCPSCDRNMGLFTVSNVCKYCRPIEQETGQTIVGVAFHDSDGWRRLPTSSIAVREKGAEIMNGPYSDATLLGDRPRVDEDQTSFGLYAPGMPMWWVKFGQR